MVLLVHAVRARGNLAGAGPACIGERTSFITATVAGGCIRRVSFLSPSSIILEKGVHVECNRAWIATSRELRQLVSGRQRRRHHRFRSTADPASHPLHDPLLRGSPSACGKVRREFPPVASQKSLLAIASIFRPDLAWIPGRSTRILLPCCSLRPMTMPTNIAC